MFKVISHLLGLLQDGLIQDVYVEIGSVGLGIEALEVILAEYGNFFLVRGYLLCEFGRGSGRIEFVDIVRSLFQQHEKCLAGRCELLSAFPGQRVEIVLEVLLAGFGNTFEAVQKLGSIVGFQMDHVLACTETVGSVRLSASISLRLTAL